MGDSCNRVLHSCKHILSSPLAFPNGTGPSVRHQSRSDAVFVRSIPGRSAHLDPTEIPPQDRDIHLVESKSCPYINPFATLWKLLLPSMPAPQPGKKPAA
eukprot:174995-Pelagomonas_calceolata.AAC.2